MVAAFLYPQVSCYYGRRKRRIRLSGETHMKRRLRASVEKGRSSTLGRSISRRGLSIASPCS
jgi:hypothetical protein